MKLVCYDPHSRRADIVEAMTGFPDVTFARPMTLAELETSLQGAEILVTSNRAYEAEAARLIRENAGALRWIQFMTSGLDKAIGLGFPPGVIVTNAAGLRAFSVAEHALFLMLSLVRQARFAEQGQRDNEWVRDGITPRMDNLAGKHLLVIGTGAIGQEIARKAKAFDMQVTGVSRSQTPLANFDALHLREKLPEVVSAADVIVMAATFEAETKGMMSRDLIGRMKPTAFLVNIGRGGLVDEDALVEALTEKRIAGAGLDVTVTEPLPSGHALYNLANVIISPHVAGAGSSGTGAGMGRILADNLRLWLAGKKLQKIVIERT